MGVRAHGPEITLFVNSQEVGRVEDNTYPEGMLAFGVDNLINGGAEGRFGNLIVSAQD